MSRVPRYSVSAAGLGLLVLIQSHVPPRDPVEVVYHAAGGYVVPIGIDERSTCEQLAAAARAYPTLSVEVTAPSSAADYGMTPGEVYVVFRVDCREVRR